MIYQHLDLIVLAAETWLGHFWRGLAAPEGLFFNASLGKEEIFLTAWGENWESDWKCKKAPGVERERSGQPRVENSQADQAEDEQTEHSPCRWTRE